MFSGVLFLVMLSCDVLLVTLSGAVPLRVFSDAAFFVSSGVFFLSLLGVVVFLVMFNGALILMVFDIRLMPCQH